MCSCTSAEIELLVKKKKKMRGRRAQRTPTERIIGGGSVASLCLYDLPIWLESFSAFSL